MAKALNGVLSKLADFMSSLAGLFGIKASGSTKGVSDDIGGIGDAADGAVGSVGDLGDSVGDLGDSVGDLGDSLGGIDGSGLDDAAGGASDLGGSAADANKKAKELAKTISGFDELNTIKLDKPEDEGSSGSGSGGKGSGGKGSGGKGSGGSGGKGSGGSGSGGSGGSGGGLLSEVYTEGDAQETEGAIDKFASKVKKIIDELFGAIKDGWNTMSSWFLAQWEYFKSAFGNFCNSLAEFLKAVWENGKHSAVSKFGKIGKNLYKNGIFIS